MPLGGVCACGAKRERRSSCQQSEPESQTFIHELPLFASAPLSHPRLFDPSSRFVAEPTPMWAQAPTYESRPTFPVVSGPSSSWLSTLRSPRHSGLTITETRADAQR
jgi:hypothetical protein